MTPQESQLERSIAAEKAKGASALERRDNRAARIHYSNLHWLISQRSPERVAEIERARGLR